MTPPRTKDGKFAKKSDGMALTIEEAGGKVYRFKDFGTLKDWLDNGKTFVNKLPPEPANPDCEVATKGYVKCIARKAWEHQHEQSAFPVASAIVTVILLAGILGIPATSPWFPSVVVGFLVSGAVAIDCFLHDTASTYKITTDQPKIIQQYEPPTCEKKRECDE